MNIIIYLNKFYLLLASLVLVCFVSVSCDDEENALDIAVTGNVEAYGCTFADIKGYVNFDLLPEGNGNIEIGIEYDYLKSGNQILKKIKVTSLVNGIFVAKIRNLPSSTEFKYRTYVKSSGLTHYGKHLSFKTKDIVNVTTTGEATDIGYTSAKLSASVQSVSADEREKFRVGIAYSTSASSLHPDSMYYVAKEYAYNVVMGDYTLSFTGLLEGTTYYYAAFTNDGENYKLSQIKNFTTKDMGISRSGAVDLGLSVKWAAYNVGASSPEEYGGYYSWGEIEESKDNREWVGYKWCNSSWGVIIKYCTKSNSRYGTIDYKTTLELEDDIAHVDWGNNWRIPTKKEYNELIDNCIWSWTTIYLNESKTDSINGYKITGVNGNSIFLPAAGYYGEHGLKNRNKAGYYWSATLFDFVECYSAYYHYSNKDQSSLKYGNRYYGTPIRPVCD